MTLQIEITPDLQAFLDTTEGVWNTEGQALVVTGYKTDTSPSGHSGMSIEFVINGYNKVFPCHGLGQAEFGRYYWLTKTGEMTLIPAEHIDRLRPHTAQFNYNLRMLHAFGVEKVHDAILRDMRFGEEAIELLQARGRSKEEVLRLVDYVYGRDIGEIEQEMGGVLTTLMAMATQNGTDLEQVTHAEMVRFTQKNQKICEKSSNKPDLTDKAQARIVELSVAVPDFFPISGKIEEMGARTYVGTKVLHAVPMTRGDYNRLRNWVIPEEENPNEEGYLVQYADNQTPNCQGFTGYISWSPADVFKKAYLPVVGATK